MTTMPDHETFLLPVAVPALRRPHLLIAAARAGQQGWRRARDLPRLLQMEACPAPDLAITRLRAEEARLNDARKAAETGYDLRRHVLVMIALLAEMNLLATSAPCFLSSTSRETAIPEHP